MIEVSNFLPRKGTETFSLIPLNIDLSIVSNFLPRKGTETTILGLSRIHYMFQIFYPARGRKL